MKIVVVTQQIELNGAVMLGLAEIELEYRQERKQAGIEVAKKKGVYRGRRKGNPERARALQARGPRTSEIAQAMEASTRAA